MIKNADEVGKEVGKAEDAKPMDGESVRVMSRTRMGERCNPRRLMGGQG